MLERSYLWYLVKMQHFDFNIFSFDPLEKSDKQGVLLS